MPAAMLEVMSPRRTANAKACGTREMAKEMARTESTVRRAMTATTKRGLSP